MNAIFRNPLSIWFSRFIKAKKVQLKNRGKNLEIGYMSNVHNCIFGLYNTIYDYVLLNECTLGDFTYVASATKISRTEIGKFCSIGPHCKIGLGKHPSGHFVSTHPIFFSTTKQAQISFADKEYFQELGRIFVGNDVWVGINVIVADDVTIGDGAIVAAGSVVTKDVPPYAIVGGIPARIIRYRFENEEIEKLLNLKWWNMDTEILASSFQKFHDVEEFLRDF